MLTTLFLVRHCQSHPAPQLSDADYPLSECGYGQARDLAPVLSTLGAEAICSSPYRRCLETLGPTAARLGLPVRTDPGLRERLISPGWISDFRELWRRSWSDLSYALEGGESSLQCRNRMVAAVDRLVREHSGKTVLVGSHGFALALFLSAFTSGYGIREASAMRAPELLLVTHGPEGYRWHRDFVPPAEFQLLARDYHETPGIVAG